MTWEIDLSVGVPFALAGLGFLLAVIQAKKARRDQYVAETLVDAYLKFERWSSRPYDKNSFYQGKEDEWCLELEDAVAKLQLLAPVEIAERVAQGIRPGGAYVYDAMLLGIIRDELRKRLGLGKVDNAPMSVRFTKNQ